MNVITDQEKQQILEGWSHIKQQPISAVPKLTMVEFLHQVEQFAQLMPPRPHAFAEGTVWKL
jgi:hypothetical protein